MHDQLAAGCNCLGVSKPSGHWPCYSKGQPPLQRAGVLRADKLLVMFKMPEEMPGSVLKYKLICKWAAHQ